MRNRQWRLLRPVRRSVQWAVILVFCVLPWLNLREWTGIYGSLFALDVYGLPFSDPSSVFWPLAHGELPTRLWLGFGTTLVMALVLGRFFCGWLCPYGLLSEYAHLAHQKAKALWLKMEQQAARSADEADGADEKADGAAEKADGAGLSAGLGAGAPATAAFAGEGAGKADLSPPHAAPHAAPHATLGALHDDAYLAAILALDPHTENQPDTSTPFWTRALVLVFGIGVSVFLGTPLLQWLSMPGTLSLLPIYGWYGGSMALAAIGVALILPLGALVVEFLTGIRLWCKWMCPQAVLLALAAKLGRPFVHVRWNEAICKCPQGHRPCAQACSLGLRSRQSGGPSRGECVQCAACVAACHGGGCGALRVGLPAAK